MASPPKTMTLSVTLTLEAGTEPVDRFIGYVLSAQKNAFRNIRDGAVVQTIRDLQTGKVLGSDISGTPSEPLQEIYDDMIDKVEAMGVKVTVQ